MGRRNRRRCGRNQRVELVDRKLAPGRVARRWSHWSRDHRGLPMVRRAPSPANRRARRQAGGTRRPTPRETTHRPTERRRRRPASVRRGSALAWRPRSRTRPPRRPVRCRPARDRRATTPPPAHDVAERGARRGPPPPERQPDHVDMRSRREHRHAPVVSCPRPRRSTARTFDAVSPKVGLADPGRTEHEQRPGTAPSPSRSSSMALSSAVRPIVACTTTYRRLRLRRRRRTTAPSATRRRGSRRRGTPHPSQPYPAREPLRPPPLSSPRYPLDPEAQRQLVDQPPQPGASTRSSR